MLSHPDYTLIRELGHGGAASVYLAVQKSLERRVAVKVLHAPALRSPDAGARFLREARTVAMLEHRHIVPVFEVGRQPEEFGYFMSMEYLPGGTLLERRAGMTLGVLLRALEQISAALACAHAQGFVHRDVKADNILFRANGEAVLTDFGIARLTESLTRMTATGAILGTAGYMSPEQLRGEGLDARSDLYSLGIVLYEMLAGRRPFVGDSIVSTGLQQLTAPPPPLGPRAAPLRPLVERLLAKSPDERPADADALRTELRRLARRLGAAADRPLGDGPTEIGLDGPERRSGTRQRTATSRGAPPNARARGARRDAVTAPQARTRAGTRRGRRGIVLAATTAIAALAAAGLGRWFDATAPATAVPSLAVGTAAAPATTSSSASPPEASVITSPAGAEGVDGGAPTDDAAVTSGPAAVAATTPIVSDAPARADAERSPATMPSPVPALETALEEAFLAERWFGDGDDGALALARRVRALEPRNASAARRLEQMRETTRRRAERALERGELTTAAVRIDELERHWPDDADTVAALRERLDETRARRQAEARAAERRRRAEAALGEAERALLGGELDRAEERLALARADLPGDERVATATTRLAAARERLAEARRARETAAALEARIDALAARVDAWSGDPDARLDAAWEALDAELGELSAAHPENAALRRLSRAAKRQASLLARTEERAAASVSESTPEDSAQRFHLPGF